jgi:hypothetical protein
MHAIDATYRTIVQNQQPQPPTGNLQYVVNTAVGPLGVYDDRRVLAPRDPRVNNN